MKPSIPLNHQRLHQAHQMMDFIDGARQANAQAELPVEHLKDWVRTAYTDQGIEVDDVLLEQALQSLRAGEPLVLPAIAPTPVPPEDLAPWVEKTFKRSREYLEAQPGGKLAHVLADSAGRVLAVNVAAAGVVAGVSLGIGLANRAWGMVSTGQPMDPRQFSPWAVVSDGLSWWSPYALPVSAALMVLFVASGLISSYRSEWTSWLKLSASKEEEAMPTPAARAKDALFGSQARARETFEAMLNMRKQRKDSFTVHGVKVSRRPKHTLPPLR